MFTCDNCMGDNPPHIYKSYGPCEVCGEVTDCSDVKIKLSEEQEAIIEDIMKRHGIT